MKTTFSQYNLTPSHVHNITSLLVKLQKIYCLNSDLFQLIMEDWTLYQDFSWAKFLDI